MSQVWLITGSSRGFGRALAEAALAGGHKLVATAHNPAQLVDLVERWSISCRTVSGTSAVRPRSVTSRRAGMSPTFYRGPREGA